MRHYEIVILIHPNQSAQVPEMVERYQSMITEGGGRIHRIEDWGRRQLAYSVEKVHKAHYLLVNIECDKHVLDELKNAFRYNDAVMRNLILKCNRAITEPSPFMQSPKKGQFQKEKQKVFIEEISETHKKN